MLNIYSQPPFGAKRALSVHLPLFYAVGKYVEISGTPVELVQCRILIFANGNVLRNEITGNAEAATVDVLTPEPGDFYRAEFDLSPLIKPYFRPFNSANLPPNFLKPQTPGIVDNDRFYYRIQIFIEWLYYENIGTRKQLKSAGPGEIDQMNEIFVTSAILQTLDPTTLY